MDLELPEPLRQSLIAHARAAQPEECVGALLGRGARVEQVVPLSNVAARPAEAFEVSARELLQVEAQAAAAGLEVLGFYHSHPRGPAWPSAADVRGQQHRWMVIVSPVHGGWGVHSTLRAPTG